MRRPLATRNERYRGMTLCAACADQPPTSPPTSSGQRRRLRTKGKFVVARGVLSRRTDHVRRLALGLRRRRKRMGLASNGASASCFGYSAAAERLRELGRSPTRLLWLRTVRLNPCRATASGPRARFVLLRRTAAAMGLARWGLLPEVAARAYTLPGACPWVSMTPCAARSPPGARATLRPGRPASSGARG